MVSAVDLLSTKSLQRKARKVMMSHVSFIPVIIRSEIRKLVMVFGLVAMVKQEKLNLVRKIDISFLNGLMKNLKSTSLIDH